MRKTPDLDAVLTNMKISNIKSIANKNIMQPSKLTKDWKRFIPEEGYEKEFQDVKLFNGDIIFCCWPNAGFWNICAMQPTKKYSDRQDIKVEEAEFVRLSNDTLYS